jgi:hypothetical protein
MSAPKRWLSDGGGATRGERDLLRLGASHEPPAAAKDAVWTALLAQLPPIPPGSSGGGAGPGVGGAKAAAGAKAAGAAGAASSGGAAVVGAASGGLLKSALIGAGGAIALIATYTVVTPATVGQPPPVAPTTIEAAAAPGPGARNAPGGAMGDRGAPGGAARNTPEMQGIPAIADTSAPLAAPGPAASTEARAGSPTPSAGRDPRGPLGSLGASSGPAAPMDRETRLLEESRRLSEARDALRRGDASGALSLLSELQRAVPGGILGQEREALAIEALAKSGRSSEAQARARAFLQAYPQSPHAPRVEAFAR